MNQFTNEFTTLLSTLNAIAPKNIGYQYSFDTDINTMAVGDEHARIDYVLYDKTHQAPLSSMNKVFILRDFSNPKMWQAFDLSDHFPVSSTFTFPKN